MLKHGRLILIVSRLSSLMTAKGVVAESNVLHPDVHTRNKRKRYLELNPDYFSRDLEFAGLHTPSLRYVSR